MPLVVLAAERNEMPAGRGELAVGSRGDIHENKRQRPVIGTCIADVLHSLLAARMPVACLIASPEQKKPAPFPGLAMQRGQFSDLWIRRDELVCLQLRRVAVEGVQVHVARN